MDSDAIGLLAHCGQIKLLAVRLHREGILLVVANTAAIGGALDTTWRERRIQYLATVDER